MAFKGLSSNLSHFIFIIYGNRDFHSLSSDLEAEVQRRGVSCARAQSQEVTQSQNLNPRLSKSKEILLFPAYSCIWFVQRLTLEPAKLAFVLCKFPAKKFLRAWSSKKATEAWIKSLYFQEFCFLFLGSSANGPVLSWHASDPEPWKHLALSSPPSSLSKLFPVCQAGGQGLPMKACLITPVCWMHTHGWYLLVRPRVFR